jgi:hypothetical protein
MQSMFVCPTPYATAWQLVIAFRRLGMELACFFSFENCLLETPRQSVVVGTVLFGSSLGYWEAEETNPFGGLYSVRELTEILGFFFQTRKLTKLAFRMRLSRKNYKSYSICAPLHIYGAVSLCVVSRS